MSQGKAKVDYLGSESNVIYGTQPSWDFIYETSTVKNPNYNIGDRVALPDGRVFRYAKSTEALNNDLLCAFYEDEVQTYDEIDASSNAAVGDKSITIDDGTHTALTEDELRGGYVIIYHTGGGGYTQFRGIIGNDAADANAIFTIYLDAPLDTAVTAGTTGVEVFYNPYAKLCLKNGVAGSAAGKPAKQVTAANQYFWVQTWGPCWLAPNATDDSFDTQHRDAYCRHDGSVEPRIATGSVGATNTTHRIGFLINEGYSTGPLLMLQISP